MSEDRCFCHFAGFAVKDATARKKLSELEAVVKENKQNADGELDNVRNMIGDLSESMEGQSAALTEQINTINEKCNDVVQNVEDQLQAAAAAQPKYIAEVVTDEDGREKYRIYNDGMREGVALLEITGFKLTTANAAGIYATALGRFPLPFVTEQSKIIYCNPTIQALRRKNETTGEMDPVISPVFFTYGGEQPGNAKTQGIGFGSYEPIESCTLRLQIELRWYENEEDA